MQKVLHGLYQSLKELNFDIEKVQKQIFVAERIINNLEMGRIDSAGQTDLTVSIIIDEINSFLEKLDKSRCVLLLDDAGHAFSNEQQQDFFEFFREIKTKTISPKAAVYPGVTTYSSSFHIGHDAEEIDVWIKPSTIGYLEFMHSILMTRFGTRIYAQLSKNRPLLDLMCFASYGIPRSLLNMFSEVNKENDSNENSDDLNIILNNRTVLQAIKNNYDRTYKIYDSLRIKLPLYSNFVAKGSEIYEKLLIIVKDFNKSSDNFKQSTIIAIQRPISSELSKVIGFFQYAGLISAHGLSSRGGKGVYELYELHYSAIVDRNVFFSSRSFNVENYCIAFNNRPNQHYPRYSEHTLLDSKSGSGTFVLALPPCHVCNTPRFSEESKFCANCGSKLKDISVFESIVSQSIENLPITPHRANTIRQNSKINTIKDILMDTDNKQLFQVPRIGPFWARRIKNYAEEFIA